jgi:hypothetical protein
MTKMSFKKIRKKKDTLMFWRVFLSFWVAKGGHRNPNGRLGGILQKLKH